MQLVTVLLNALYILLGETTAGTIFLPSLILFK